MIYRCTCLPRMIRKTYSARELKLREAMDTVFKQQMNFAFGLVEQNHRTFKWVASEEWANEIARLTKGVIGVEVEQSGIAAGKKLGVHLIDFIDRPQVQHAIKDHVMRFSFDVNEASMKSLKRTFLEADANGETMDEVKDRVMEVFGWDPEEEPEEGQPSYNYRAERIARTEMIRAHYEGDEQAWKQSGVVVAKIWRANPNACEFCQAMDGEVVEIDKVFIPKGGHLETDDGAEMEADYESIKHPPLHPNCLCHIEAKLDESFGLDEDSVTNEGDE